MPQYESLEYNWGHILAEHPTMTKELIDKVLEEPSNEYPRRHDGRKRFWKMIRGKKYVVVVKEWNAYEADVITGYPVTPK